MTKAALTPFNYLVLGLLRRNPGSGYQVCRQIESMPIGTLSSSPGSIYPCLKKLVSLGFLAAIERGGVAKPRMRYELTTKGKRALSKWLNAPLDVALAIRSPEALIIKTSFMVDAGRSANQLRQLSDALAESINALRDYQATTSQHMAIGGRLAMDLSIAIATAMRDWATDSSESLSPHH